MKLHVFVDTNIFLGLYAYTDDKIDELTKFVNLIKAEELVFYISAIVNQEFHRNRDKKIFESPGNLEKFSTSLTIPRFVEHHPEVSELRNLLRQVKEKKSELIEKAKEEIISRKLAADKLFSELIRVSPIVALSDEADSLARVRLERKNPPGKDGSLGDRQNWEMLLEKVPNGQNIHLISRDKDFSSPLGADVPNSYLASEWENKKKSSYYLYPDLKSFVLKHYPEITIAADVEKTLAIKSLVASNSFQETHTAISKLSPLITDLSKEEIRVLFMALIENGEINGISSDDDIQEFYEQLLTDHWGVLSGEEYKAVINHVPDPIHF